MMELGWQEASYAGDFKVQYSLPSNHSRRGLLDANTSLWAVFSFGYHGFKVYFGSDSAMGPVFVQTDHKYGPIDYVNWDQYLCAARATPFGSCVTRKSSGDGQCRQIIVATGNALGND